MVATAPGGTPSPRQDLEILEQALRVSRRYWPNDPDELRSVGHEALVTARATFDPQRGAYATWVFLICLNAMRAEANRLTRRARSLCALQEAALRYATELFPDPTQPQTAEDRALSDVSTLSSSFLASLVSHVALTVQVEPNAEDVLLERERVEQTRAALKDALRDVDAGLQQLLVSWMRDRVQITELARRNGLPYHTLRRRLHALQADIGDHLDAVGLARLPHYADLLADVVFDPHAEPSP
jgi:hypothetical protein